MIPKKDISNAIETQNCLSSVSYRNRKVYSPTKVKARNFLTNIYYNRVKGVDLTKYSFIIICYIFTLFYLNSFYFERKFEDVVDRLKIKALWNCFMPSDFYIFICKSEHFTTLNKISLKYQTAYEIITKFIEEVGLAQLKCFFKNNAFIYQSVYSTLFLKYVCQINSKAIESKCCFELSFNNYNAQKNEGKPKRKRKQQNEKIERREEKKKKLESDLEVNTEKLNNIKKKKKL